MVVAEITCKLREGERRKEGERGGGRQEEDKKDNKLMFDEPFASNKRPFDRVAPGLNLNTTPNPPPNNEKLRQEPTPRFVIQIWSSTGPPKIVQPP